MQIRRATLEEIPAVTALAREAFGAAVAPLYGDEGRQTFQAFSEVEAMRTRMGANYVTYVAREGERLLGMAQVRDGHHLAMLFVRPGEQRRGIGRRLVEFLLTEGTGDAITVAASPNAEPAYRRFGFQSVGAPRTEKGISFQMMELRLNASERPVEDR